MRLTLGLVVVLAFVASGCQHHPTDPYGLLVYKSGTYTVCANTGSCCSVEVER